MFMAEKTTIHKPYSEAPTVTGEYATCGVCHTQWQVRGEPDKQGCRFCGSDDRAITVSREDQDS